MRYLWAAYKKGSLAELDAFAETGMSAETFQARLEAELDVNFHAAWTLFGQTKRGFLPVGLVLGFWSSPDPKLSPFMILGAMIWFPWASPRNRIESAVNFFAKMRNELPMVEYAREKDKKFFEHIARHGVLRRVGTMRNVYEKEPAAVFETIRR